MDDKSLTAAKEDIVAYISSCGKKWFQARHTSRERVLNNEPLLLHAAREQNRNVSITHISRAASAKDICDEELSGYPEFQ